LALWHSGAMRLTPRYGADPIITLDGSASEIRGPMVRQRRRLAAVLASFTDEQWAHPSRCEGWSNRDVVVHLDSTNRFWAYSIAAGRRGEPTRLLATFDPVVSPAQLVAASHDVPPGEVLDQFTASTESLVDLVASLDDHEWSVLAEAPPGHLSVSAVCHHALWDAWVHERDILLPLGVAPEEEADEITACLRYVAALAPAFAISRGTAGLLSMSPSPRSLSWSRSVTGLWCVRAPPAPHCASPVTPWCSWRRSASADRSTRRSRQSCPG
jgi:uncharacterized protein (TIGR03083 family)